MGVDANIYPIAIVRFMFYCGQDLRVCLKRSTSGDSANHDANHRNVDKGLT